MGKQYNIVPLLAVLFLYSAWHLSVVVWEPSPLIFPSPGSVRHEVLHSRPGLQADLLYTTMTTLAGMVFGCLISCILTMVLISYKKHLHLTLQLIVGGRSLPIIALAPLLVIRIGTGTSFHIVSALLVGFFPLLLTLLQGVAHTDHELLVYLQAMGASRSQIRRHLYRPSLLPFLFTGLKIASSYCLIGAIVSEFVSSQQGLGYLIRSASYYSDTPRMFVGILCCSALGIGMYSLLYFLEKRVVYWQ